MFEYQDHPQLQLFCADKLTKVKKAPPLVREISELVRIIAHVKIDRDYINAVNNLAKLIEKIEKKGIADMEAPVFDQLTKVLELDEKGNHEKAEDIFQKAYKKTKETIPQSADLHLLIVSCTILVAEYQLLNKQSDQAYATLMQILGPCTKPPTGDEEYVGPIYSTLKLLLAWSNEKLIINTLMKSILLLHKVMLEIKDSSPEEQKAQGNRAIGHMFNELSSFLIPRKYILGIDGSTVGYLYPEKYRDLYKGPLPDVDEQIRQTIIILCDYLHENITGKLEADYYEEYALHWPMNSFAIMRDDNEKYLVDFDDPSTPFENIVYRADLQDLEHRGFIIYSQDRSWFTLRKDLINCHSYNVLVEQGLLTTYEAGFLKGLLEAVTLRLEI